ncbi:MAG: Maf family protein [Bacillota bacterium]
MQKIILASASPRRRELLTQIGLAFDVEISDVDENCTDDNDPVTYVCGLAYRKAAAVAEKIPAGIVVGADTVVVARGEILGKPADAAEAGRMLQFLNGTEHEVLTGVAVIDAAAGRSTVSHELTKVVFRQLTSEEIKGYIASGEPFDKAGAYGIQGLGAVLVKEIHGDYFNVVGLPLARLTDMLREFGIRVLG